MTDEDMEFARVLCRHISCDHSWDPVNDMFAKLLREVETMQPVYEAAKTWRGTKRCLSVERDALEAAIDKARNSEIAISSETDCVFPDTEESPTNSGANGGTRTPTVLPTGT